MKKFRFRNGEFILSGKPLVMGILNVTPDSFSDGGEFFSAENAVRHAKQMILDGADIIDVGAMSTRPGSEPVSVSTEIERLAPVLAKLAETANAVISVDTVNPETAEFALSSGAHIINDVSGLFRKEMAEVVKKYNAGWVITHTSDVPAGTVVEYPSGVVSAVNVFFDEFLSSCLSFGIDKEHICLDPGFGFAKTTQDNKDLLKNLEKTVKADVAFMSALSRKRFIGEICNVECAADRLAGTLAADLIAVMKGADIIRVHDVKESCQSLALYNSIV